MKYIPNKAKIKHHKHTEYSSSCLCYYCKINKDVAEKIINFIKAASRPQPGWIQARKNKMFS